MLEGTPTHPTPRDTAGNGASGPHWRRITARELSVLLALKLVALVVLWWMFFSPAHRTPVDAPATGRQLGVEPPTPAQPAARADEEGARP